MASKTFKKLWLPLIIVAVCAVAIAVTLVLVLPGGGDGGLHIVPEPGAVRGELQLRLQRERLETLTLNSRGVPTRKEDTTLTDFSTSKDNVFGIDGNILIGPGCYFTAEMAVGNQKPYAFEYWLEIVPAGGASALAGQQELTVTLDGEIFLQRTLDDGLTTDVLAKVASGQTARFTVCLKYLDVYDNDDTQNSVLMFDMAVHARLIAQ